ncbi:carbohydrate-binding protein [Cellulomonas sp. JZ18]|uniref:glycoside hydrolase family 3 N-terminal domain-containing protein n=1 Tax=Cellulomonas sp. JZ18 TaxID=2654191 RepID=UPI0012D46FA1|nr:glycoside hydrolase family 3 N-terminal domain-containing protein [Cellulomonas sp. JZ18]QGQ20465.1 carbohydrate-binding protein [Cellulomonas sp. JZ18]
MPVADRRALRTRLLVTAAVVAALAVPAAVPAAGPARAAAPPPYRDPGRPVTERAEDLLGRMTLDEKVGQMTLVERRWLTAEALSSGWVGVGFSSGESRPATNTPAGWADLYDGHQRAALQNRLGIPLLYAVNAVHGFGNLQGATVVPHQIGLGATGDPALVQQLGRMVAREVSALGVDATWSPVTAVARDDRWGRTYESFGEDPAAVAALSAAYVRGFQGGSVADRDAVVAGAKHFVADGGTAGGVDRGDAPLTRAQVEALHLPPARAAVDAGAGVVMVSFSSIAGERLHGSRYWLTDVLKGRLGFDGFVVSDYGGIDFLDGDAGDISAYDVRTALNAGIDVVMVPDEWRRFHELVVQEVRAGRVPQSRVDDAVRRVLITKLRKGLFEDPFADRARLGAIGSADHRALARRAVAASTVVLKNEWDVLPLPRSASKVLVAGVAADDVGRQSGGWTLRWQGQTGNAMPGTTILEGVRAAVRGTVTYSPDGSAADGSHQSAIVVVGEDPYAEWHGDDDGDMRLSARDRAVIDRVAAAGVPITLVLLTGRPLDVNAELHQVRAAVAAWLPGTEGDGVTDVLFGTVAPTGRLPVTWPYDAVQQPINAGDGKNALFPLGHGLRYPATASPYATIGASFYDDQRGTAVETCTDVGCGQSVGRLADGDYLGWFGLDFGGTSPRSVSVRVASGSTASGWLEVRRDQNLGPLLARVPLSPTGGWQRWETRTVPLSASVTGVHRVYLQVVGPPDGTEVGNVSWLRFDR